MNRRTLRNALRILGVTLVVLLPVVLALWFAQIRAKAETSDRLRAFSQLALQKTEMVVYEADRAREKALQFKGEMCSAGHQQYMLSIVRSLLYVDDLIYADGPRLFCSTALRPDSAWRIPPANYTKSRISLSTITAIRLSIPALR